jgi:hypothetical protein
MTELEEYQEELEQMLMKADYESAIAFWEKWNPELPVPEDEMVVIAGLHKVRVQLGIGVEESTKWLNERGLSTETHNLSN